MEVSKSAGTENILKYVGIFSKKRGEELKSSVNELRKRFRETYK